LRIFNGVSQYNCEGETCLTVGTFDGVHIGHKKILKKLISTAKQNGWRSVLLTFYPHPRKVIFPDDHGLKMLNTLSEKLALLESIGIDDVIIQPFSKEFSRYEPIEYVRDVLKAKLAMRHIVIGYDHRFGKNREGGIEQLRELAPLYDFDITEISALDVDEVNVSSTKIRKALENGETDIASTYLDYSYHFTGVVVAGESRGKELGFPTANLEIEDDTKLIPRNGVYAVRVELDGNQIHGVMNIGHKPTFSENEPKSIEVHLFEFDKDIYGKELIVTLVAYLRSETKFGSADALINQLEDDKSRALEILG